MAAGDPRGWEHAVIPGFQPESELERALLHEPELRLLTLLHDTFKFRVQEDGTWSPDNDHAELARRFAERLGCPERIAATLALHDAAYWVWHRRGGDGALLESVLARAPDRDLLIRFVRLDAATHGKDPAFLRWFDAATAGE